MHLLAHFDLHIDLRIQYGHFPNLRHSINSHHLEHREHVEENMLWTWEMISPTIFTVKKYAMGHGLMVFQNKPAEVFGKFLNMGNLQKLSKKYPRNLPDSFEHPKNLLENF